jgi:DNA primase
MSYPKNPDTIIVKNKFYPKGITELMIWNYYQKVKVPLLKEVMNRDLMFFIMVDENKSIIKRKLQDKYIRLIPKNYDELITGRTISIHSSMGGYETFGIIDIDIDPSDGFIWARKVAADVYEYVMDKMGIVRSAQIRFTGKNSFHIVCYFGRKMKIDSIRFLLRKFLQQSELSKVYTIEGKRRPGIPNLDMAPNKFHGNFITLHSLSIWGLRCVEVPYNKLFTFNPITARI